MNEVTADVVIHGLPGVPVLGDDDQTQKRVVPVIEQHRRQVVQGQPAVVVGGVVHQAEVHLPLRGRPLIFADRRVLQRQTAHDLAGVGRGGIKHVVGRGPILQLILAVPAIQLGHARKLQKTNVTGRAAPAVAPVGAVPARARRRSRRRRHPILRLAGCDLILAHVVTEGHYRKDGVLLQRQRAVCLGLHEEVAALPVFAADVAHGGRDVLALQGLHVGHGLEGRCAGQIHLLGSRLFVIG